MPLVTASPVEAASSAAAGSARRRRGGPRVTHETHQPMPLDILASLDQLPCAVFPGHPGHYGLYAAAGGNARDVVAHAGCPATMAIRNEDRDVLRRGLARSVSRILGDESR